MAQWEVYDSTNWAENSVTSAQMLLQVANSNQEVDMLLRNLVSVASGRYYYPNYTARLREVIDTARGGPQLHYNVPNLDAYLYDVFRGYTSIPKWRSAPDNFQYTTAMALNAQRSTMNTVHVDLNEDDDNRMVAIQDQLRLQANAATGAKDLGQLQFNMLDHIATQQQRERHTLGAIAQAISTENQYRINLDALSQKAQDDYFLRARTPAQPYTGQGGIGQIELR